MKVTAGDLRKIKFFDSYNPAQIDILCDMCSYKEFAVKQVLFEQYDKLSEVYILTKGILSLGINLAEEKRIHLGTIEEGQLFSWSAVFSPFISTAWVIAMTPAEVIAIDAKKLSEEIERDCNFGLKTMTQIALTISHRLSDTRFQLMNQMTL